MPYGKQHVLDRLHLGVSCSVVDHEFAVDESIIYIKYKGL